MSGFVRQASILAGASVFVRLLGFAYRLPLTDLIGDEGNAYYITAYTVYTFALVLSSGTMVAAISRLTSERIAKGQYRNAHRLFKTAMGLVMSMGLVAGLIMFFGADLISQRIFNMPEVAHSVRALTPAVFFASILAVFRGYFQGMKTSVPTALSQVIEQIFKVAFSVWLAFLFLDAAFVEYAAAGAALGTAISLLPAIGVVLWLYSLISKDLRKRAEDDLRRDYETRSFQVASILRTAFPMIIGVGLVSLGNFLDISMATSRLDGAFSEDEIRVLVGQFNGKFILLTTLPVSLSMALSAAVIPEITSSRVTFDDDAVRQKTNMAMRLSMIISIPAAVGLSVLADPIVALLFPAHPEGGWLLRYGAVSIVLLAMVQILTGVLQGIGHVGIPVIGMFFGVAAKIPVNYFLMAIPSINILGAVISTIVCFAVAGLLNLFFLYRFTGILPQVGSMFVKPLVASAGMGFICFGIYYLAALHASNSVATIAALLSGGIAYLILMVLIRGFKPRDVAALPLPRGIRRLLGS
ncbi:MAG: polysaccharide biosynthesis protein [Defluviitaleaceae bacterium]|nr:polysaccharide biosynthesis protein [Defluviitaleaceae bacterium]